MQRITGLSRRVVEVRSSEEKQPSVQAYGSAVCGDRAASYRLV